MQHFRILPAGDSAIVVEFGNVINQALSSRVLALDERLRKTPPVGVIETLPTFRSLLISFDPKRSSHEELAGVVGDLFDANDCVDGDGRLWRLPVCYDPSVAPDLDDVARRAGLTRDEVVARHCGARQHVYMLGFLPGQPYLGDLDPAIELPRRETPRVSVPAGSVGIAGRMTCAFPRETPCGLHVIGRTPVQLWFGDEGPRSLLSPGDQVEFVPVSLRDFEIISKRAAKGESSRSSPHSGQGRAG